MNNSFDEKNLIGRYIYAVTRRLPQKEQEDVSAELNGLISDMLAERCGDVTPTEKDVRVVLTELGSPSELYDKYDPDSGKCLIGPPYYGTYKLVLKLVMLCAGCGLALAGILEYLVSPRGVWYECLFDWISVIVSGLLSAFAFVTLLFAFFYRKGIKINMDTSLDDLPSVPQKKQTISKWEPICGIAFSVIFLVIFLAIPQIFSAYVRPADRFVPVFDCAAIRSEWYILIMFSALGMAREVVKLLEGRYNTKVMIVTIVVNALSAVLAFWWLVDANILNPEFIGYLREAIDGSNDFVMSVMENFVHVFLAVMIFALVLDTIESVVKALRN